jgi:hypothetical protein
VHRKTRLPPVWRAVLLLAAAHARRLRARARQNRHALTSALLVVSGMAGGLGGAALVGMWCLGLVLMAESGGLVWFGLMRDDGTGLPRRGARTVAEVLEDERLRP